jgi:hypothetical protein
MSSKKRNQTKRHRLITQVASEESVGRVRLIFYVGTECQCGICMEPIGYHETYLDVVLACGCMIHYECLILYIRSHLGDRITLLSHGKNGILCPYIRGQQCNFASEFTRENTLRQGIQHFDNSYVPSEKRFLIMIDDLVNLVQLGLKLKKYSLQKVKPLSQDEVERLKIWIQEGYFGSESIDDNQMDPLLVATTKRCPSCNYRGTHYHGHHCHHISPFGGCPICSTHYCFRCLSSGPENLSKRGNINICNCGKYFII